MIIGCGNIAGQCDDPATTPPSSHGQAIVQHGELKILSCVDTDPIAATDFARKYGADHVFNTIEEIDKGLSFDLAVVCTPDDTNFDIVSSLLKTRPGTIGTILVEKPVCRSTRELEILLALGRDKNIPIFINMS